MSLLLCIRILAIDFLDLSEAVVSTPDCSTVENDLNEAEQYRNAHTAALAENKKLRDAVERAGVDEHECCPEDPAYDLTAPVDLKGYCMSRPLADCIVAFVEGKHGQSWPQKEV